MSRQTFAVFLGLAFVAALSVALLKKSSGTPSRASGINGDAVIQPSIGPATSPTVSAGSAEVRDLQNRLTAERQARQRAEGEAAELRKQVAPLASNVVVSLGTVSDIGKRAGAFLPVMGELTKLTARDPKSLSAEEKLRLLELQRDHAQLLGTLPQITSFQDNPDEYGRFFSSMIQQAASLPAAAGVEIEKYMRQRGETMNQLRLNSANQPTDAKLRDDWEEKRDDFNEDTAKGLKSLLPPGVAEQIGLNSTLMEFLEMDFDKLTPPK